MQIKNQFRASNLSNLSNRLLKFLIIPQIKPDIFIFIYIDYNYYTEKSES